MHIALHDPRGEGKEGPGHVLPITGPATAPPTACARALLQTVESKKIYDRAIVCVGDRRLPPAAAATRALLLE